MIFKNDKNDIQTFQGYYPNQIFCPLEIQDQEIAISPPYLKKKSTFKGKRKLEPQVA